MTGRRIDVSPHFMEPLDYGLWEGTWYGYCPGEGRLIANFEGHKVVEHADLTITVGPSIRCSWAKHTWHGFLEQGVWREA